MKKIFLLIGGLFFLLPMQAQQTLTMMTYNIKNATGMDGVCSFQRIADVVMKTKPDVVALQEVDSMTLRSGRKDVLAEIANRVHMHGTFAPAISFDGGKYGVALLSKEKPLRLQVCPLPGREEARVLLLAEFKDYIFCCTHLSLTEQDRMKSLDLIQGFLASSSKPCFLAGDLNDTPTSHFIKELQKNFRLLSDPKSHTFPAPKPVETLDYIAVWRIEGEGVEVKQSLVLEEPLASDHRPVSIVLKMGR